MVFRFCKLNPEIWVRNINTANPPSLSLSECSRLWSENEKERLMKQRRYRQAGWRWEMEERDKRGWNAECFKHFREITLRDFLCHLYAIMSLLILLYCKLLYSLETSTNGINFGTHLSQFSLMTVAEEAGRCRGTHSPGTWEGWVVRGWDRRAVYEWSRLRAASDQAGTLCGCLVQVSVNRNGEKQTVRD